MVGLFPENTISNLHIIGAATAFRPGECRSWLFMGLVADFPRSLPGLCSSFGIVSLLALIAFLTHQYLGIGIGGMERIVICPQTVWLIIFAIYCILPTSRLAREGQC